MARVLSLFLCLVVSGSSASASTTSGNTRHDSSTEPRHFADINAVSTITSNSSDQFLARRETAGPDTFCLYGGPDSPTEGKFQLGDRVTPDWGGGNGLPWTGAAGEWTPVDLTDQPVYWHRSQFNAQTLGTNQPSPNHAMWSGVDVGDPAGASWVHLPGYGNNWNDGLLYESEPLANPSVGQVVDLDFYFHHDTEPGWDFFSVEYDSAGVWTSVLVLDGSDKDASNVFNAPGVRFSTVSETPIRFVGNDYGGNGGDQIRIRFLVTTDGGWSDEDGIWPTTAGAAQIDEITLTTSQGTFTEDYEAVLVPPARYLFHYDKSWFAGDFAEVYPRFTDIDPCRDNDTPVIGMIDYSQIIRNGPGLSGDDRTGGSTSPGVNYGIVGNFVVNYSGGLSFGLANVTNEIWSPDIYWDLPGTDDDGIEISGAFFRASTWWHLPILNGIFMVWHVRSALAGEPYDAWADRGFVYFWNAAPLWGDNRIDVSDLLQPGSERVQVALGTWDYASIFGFPGTESTPSPVFDNVALYKYRLGGPSFAGRQIDLAQDGFPVSGSIDVSSPATRDALDIPFSMARDVNTGSVLNVAGDSVIVDVTSVIPGATVTDIRMVWALKTNDVFEDALRAAPNRAKDVNVVTGPAGTVWTGEVIADTSKNSAGAIIADRYFFDLPDVDLMYPGDVLHYYIQATDSDGRTTTFPAVSSGFLDFSPTTAYDRTFTMRCLPSITDTGGSQPETLIWFDAGWNRAVLSSFQNLGYGEGVDYDTYTTQGPSSAVSNGLGSSGVHGANADQIAGYHNLFYFAGQRSTTLLSNGSGGDANDKGDDIDLLEQWHARPGARNSAYFGDYIATGLINGSAEGLAYTSSLMGINYGDSDVRDVIGGQTVPLIIPNSESPYASIFSTNYHAYGGCLLLNEFDQIQPIAGAFAGHLFTDVNGTPIPEDPDPAVAGVASVINPTLNGVNITFPHAFGLITTPQAREVSLASRTYLIAEILQMFGAAAGTTPIVSAPSAARPTLAASPNPFNPRTKITFTAQIGAKGSVKVFNLRGELVRTLHEGEFQTQEFIWDGTDHHGASVASGVYILRADAGGEQFSRKVALVR